MIVKVHNLRGMDEPYENAREDNDEVISRRQVSLPIPSIGVDTDL
jgi:hypothetical protein